MIGPSLSGESSPFGRTAVETEEVFIDNRLGNSESCALEVVSLVPARTAKEEKRAMERNGYPASL